MISCDGVTKEGWAESVNNPFKYWGAKISGVDYDHYNANLKIIFKVAKQPWVLEFKRFAWLTFDTGKFIGHFKKSDSYFLEGAYFKDVEILKGVSLDDIHVILGKLTESSEIGYISLKIVARDCEEAILYTASEPSRSTTGLI